MSMTNRGDLRLTLSLAIGISWLGAGAASIAEGPPKKLLPAVDPEVLKLIPESLIYRRVPLPSEQNALEALKKARLLTVTLDAFEADRKLRTRLADVLDWQTSPPTEAEKERLRILIARNQAAFEALDEAIVRGRLQFDAEDAMHEWFSIRALQKIRLGKARLLIGQGNSTQATREIIQVLRLGTKLRQADGETMLHVLGGASEEVALSKMLIWAAAGTMPEESFERLLPELQRSAEAENAYAIGVRLDFRKYILPRLSRITLTGSLEEVVEAMFKRRRPVQGLVDEQRAVRRQDVLALLSGHPAPFNREETIRYLASSFVFAVQNESLPWSQQKWQDTETIRHELAAWPKSLLLHLLPAPWSQGEEQPAKLSDDEVARAREQLSKVRNPLGKLLIAELLYDRALASKVHQHRAGLEAAYGSLGIQLYVRRNDGPPASWDDLLAAKILTRAPRDPFDDRPLRYAPERGVIWSIGANSKDDGGATAPSGSQGFGLFDYYFPPSKTPPAPPPGSPILGRDLVWEMMPLR